MTAEFLLEVGTPPVRPDRVVLQIPAEPPSEAVLSALQRLQFSGYTIALDGYDPALAGVAKLVRIPVAGRTDEELQAAIAEPAARGLELVATGVATPEELARCSALGFTIFQGEFFGRPDHTRQRRVGTGGVASLAALAAVARPDASFEDLEHAIGNDVGLSLKLLRYVNSAFFALPRTVESVREALTLLGTATVRRWATVMALVSAADDAPEELVELALQRARMCEVLGGNRAARRLRRPLHRRSVLGRRRAARLADAGRPRDAPVLRRDPCRAAATARARRASCSPPWWPTSRASSPPMTVRSRRRLRRVGDLGRRSRPRRLARRPDHPDD